jgi:hypothetical protein
VTLTSFIRKESEFLISYNKTELSAILLLFNIYYGNEEKGKKVAARTRGNKIPALIL